MCTTKSINMLILAGGRSTRMGKTPKHLLQSPHGKLYRHLVRVLHEAAPTTDTVHFSIRGKSKLDQDLRKGVLYIPDQDFPEGKPIKLQLVKDETAKELGPAAGLLAAHHADPTATWLVIGCDYPLLEAAAIRQLTDHYESPATCFKNSAGFSEPLLGIWSSQALGTLEENVKSGNTSPSYTLRQLQTKLIVPTREDWLTNVNTKPQWEAAKLRLESAKADAARIRVI